MGDLSVTVRLCGHVVEQQVLRVPRVVRLGESADAAVSFPGADFGVLRVGNRLCLRGRTLDEGDELELELGQVHVTLEHTARARLPHEWEGAWDRRFLAAVMVVVAAGSWVDAAHSWLSHRADSASTTAVARIATTLTGSAVSPDPRRAAAVSRSDGPPEPSSTVTIPDAPPHEADDRATGTGWSHWYRRAVPRDLDQVDTARARLGADPDDVGARRIVARAAYDEDDHEAAADHFRQLLDRSPGDPDARLRLAWAQKRQGYHRSELRQYEAILAVDPGHVQALAGKTVALARLNRLGEAELMLDLLEGTAPDSVELELAEAKLAGLHGDEEAALSLLEGAYSRRDQLTQELQLELRRDLAIDPSFAALRKDPRLRSLVNRHLGAAGPRQAR